MAIKETNINGLIIAFLIILVSGAVFLIFSQIPTGYVLGLFFVLGISLFLFLTFFYNEKASGVVLPFNKSLPRAVIVYLLGLFSIILLLSVFVVLTPTLKASIIDSAGAISPLSTLSLSITSKTFAILDISHDAFWNSFIIRRIASISEEIVLGFIAVQLFVLFSALVLRPFLNIKLSNTSSKYFDYSIGFIGSIIIFSSLHFFSGNYHTFGDYSYAAILRLILNFFIYFGFKWGIEFSIGIHEGLNTVAQYLANPSQIIQGFFSLGGIIELIFYLLIFYYTITVIIPKISKYMSEVFNAKYGYEI